LNTIVSIFGIYAFILLGWVAKKIFKEQIDEKSLVLISIYFLSPILVFWGLTTQKIDTTAIKAPFIFFVVTILALAISLVFANFLFKDKKDRSIATVASIVGNTGNLGIPLGIALFGEASVLYTSIINLANIFIINTVGVFFYARGEFSTKEAFLKIFALPAIWFGVFGILFNLSNLTIPSSISLSLQMGAYANMVIQLFIFGMYLYGVKTKEIDFRLFTFVSVLKFVITPILALYILSLFTLEDVIYNVILLELLVPLAVTNVNLSALYNCKVNQVTFLVFSTSVIFLGYIFLVLGMFR
jgi:predicted permease